MVIEEKTKEQKSIKRISKKKQKHEKLLYIKLYDSMLQDMILA